MDLILFIAADLQRLCFCSSLLHQGGGFPFDTMIYYLLRFMIYTPLENFPLCAFCGQTVTVWDCCCYRLHYSSYKFIVWILKVHYAKLRIDWSKDCLESADNKSRKRHATLMSLKIESKGSSFWPILHNSPLITESKHAFC